MGLLLFLYQLFETGPYCPIHIHVHNVLNRYQWMVLNVLAYGPYAIHSRHIQYNLNGSNTDGSFTVDDSNSLFSPYKILPIAQENKYLGTFSYFIMALYVVCTH